MAALDTFSEDTYGLSFSRKGSWVFMQDISPELRRRLRQASSDPDDKKKNLLVAEMVIEPGSSQENWFPSFRIEKVLTPTGVSATSISAIQLTQLMVAQTGKSDPSFVLLKQPTTQTLAGREVGFAEFEVTVYPLVKTNTGPTVMHYRVWFIPVENGWLRMGIAAPKPQWDQIVKTADEVVA